MDDRGPGYLIGAQLQEVPLAHCVHLPLLAFASERSSVHLRAKHVFVAHEAPGSVNHEWLLPRQVHNGSGIVEFRQLG